MSNTFNKVIGLITVFMICSFAFAQPEPVYSRDNLAVVLNREDTSQTENYLIDDFETFVDASRTTEEGDSFRNVEVSFRIKDLTDFSSARVEILVFSKEGQIRVVTRDFLLSQLTLKESSNVASVIIPVENYPSDVQYSVNIMVQSSEAMIDRILTKIILL